MYLWLHVVSTTTFNSQWDGTLKSLVTDNVNYLSYKKALLGVVHLTSLTWIFLLTYFFLFWTDNFCLRYQGRLQNGYGIVWIKRKGLKGFSCRVHLVGMFLAGMKTPDFLHFQTSHICMKRNCIRTSHLVFETDIDNKKRIKCNRPPRSCQCNLTPKCFPRYTWNGTFQSQVRKDPTKKKHSQEK